MKVRRIEATWQLIKNFFTEGSRNEVTTDGIPAGARLLGVHNDVQTRRLILMIEHPSFDDIPEGGTIPLMNTIVVGKSMEKKPPQV